MKFQHFVQKSAFFQKCKSTKITIHLKNSTVESLEMRSKRYCIFDAVEAKRRVENLKRQEEVHFQNVENLKEILHFFLESKAQATETGCKRGQAAQAERATENRERGATKVRALRAIRFGFLQRGPSQKA